MQTRPCHDFSLLLAGLSPWSSGLSPNPVHVGSVVNQVPLEQTFLRVLRLSPVNVLPPVLHTYSSITDGI